MSESTAVSRSVAIDLPDTDAPAAPLSWGVRRGPFLWVSGQVSVDWTTGESIHGDIVDQTTATLANVRRVLEAGGASLADVVKTTVFLTDIRLAPAMNAVYAEIFSDHPLPSRSTVQVGPLGRPEFLIEIEAQAYVDATMSEPN
ncbi:RidA family protein [soil metagenome]